MNLKSNLFLIIKIEEIFIYLCKRKNEHLICLVSKPVLKSKKMLNSVPNALVKQVIMETFFQKLYIQCFESVKNYLITSTFIFNFLF
jgi:hypothetical protein